jgi:hypothetical protein
MSMMKAIWRLVLCSLFVIGLTCGLAAHATEPEGHEKAMHETQEATEAVEPAEGEAAEEAQKAETEEAAHGEEETHEAEGEAHE